jgi:acetyl-CoA carboxylase biotin carboxylase subunit
MFEKILIANRGEIALRIIRACKELGIQTVAVYSEADEQSLHVQLADGAICIGPAAANKSYLRANQVIAAAEIADVDAIHPGYGFLAEDANFADQVNSCKIAFIGPDAQTISNMGDKSKAREMAVAAGTPTVPGSDGTVDTLEEAHKVAEEIGYPVLIKAVAGGGGKGMRVAHNQASFGKEYNAARYEAEQAFGNGAVYLEKFIENPRHIEIQVIADNFGNVVALGERDCSIQRRHQKVIEEAPSPFITPEMREKMYEAAIAITKYSGYRNAGTIEFLVDKHRNFYFIEMNTRIQVEHPITEQVTGIDLIKEQILVAAGKPLSFTQKDITLNRHSIECRICAEDPSRNFAPSPGKLDLYYAPGGPGIRVDSHVYSGYNIPPQYDSMIAKLIATGKTREEALIRMQRALSEYLIRGIKTNIPFLRTILADSLFKEGKYTTKFVQDFLDHTPKELYSEIIEE